MPGHSAYGLDVKYRTGFWTAAGQDRMFDWPKKLANCAERPALGSHALRLPIPHVERILPMMAQGRVLPYLDVPSSNASDVLSA